MQYTYDRSAALELALVADAKLSDCRYVPLAEAPTEERAVDQVYLRQMHAVANSVADGLVVRPRMPLQAEKWERRAGR